MTHNVECITYFKMRQKEISYYDIPNLWPEDEYTLIKNEIIFDGETITNRTEMEEILICIRNYPDNFHVEFKNIEV